MARASIDANVCKGHGLCVLIAPTLFEIDDSGVGVATAQEIDPAQLALAEEARDNCPAQAISVD